MPEPARSVMTHGSDGLAESKNGLENDHDIADQRDAANSIRPNVSNLSDEEIQTKLDHVQDSTATTESHELTMAILHECAARPGLAHLCPSIFRLLSRPIYASVRRQQMLALKSLIADAPIELRRGFLDFSLAALGELFDSAEKARSMVAVGDIRENNISSNRLNSRPEPEVTLLRHLVMLSRVTESDLDVFQLDKVSELMTLLSQLLQKTTGQAIMRHLLEVLSYCACKARKAPRNLQECLLLLCQLSADEEAKSHADAFRTLGCFLTGHLRVDSLRNLARHVCIGSSIPLLVRSAALRAIAEHLPALEAIDVGKEAATSIVTMLSGGLREAVGPVGSVPCLAEPLTDIARSCFAIVEGKMLEDLLHAIRHLANLEEPAAEFARAVNLPFVKGLVDLFLSCFQRQGKAASLLFDMLVIIAASAESIDVKLYSMKLLIRLRCNEDFGILVVKEPDEQSLTDILRRDLISVATSRVTTSPSSQHSGPSQSSASSKDTRRKTLTPNRNRSQSRSRPLSTKGSIRSNGQSLWMYDETRRSLPSEPPQGSSACLYTAGGSCKDDKSKATLTLDAWLQVIIDQLRSGSDWELLSYVLVHLPSQLGNCSLFKTSVRQIGELHDLLNEHLCDNLFLEPPPDSGAKRGDVALCLYHSLAMLLAYQDSVGVRQWKRVVSTFRVGIEKWDAVGKYCIHVLSVCCYEIPNIILNQVTLIVEMLQKRLTQFDLAMDVLEFLSSLARTPEAYDKHDFSLHQKIFGICIRYLQHSREQRSNQNLGNRTSTYSIGQRTSGSSNEGFRRATQERQDRLQRIVHEYIFTTAYQVIIFWFLAIDIRDRPRHSAWITQELTWKNENDTEELEQQSLVILDMMHRTTYSNLGETYPAPQFLEEGRTVHRRLWIVGLSIITLEVLLSDSSGKPELGQLTKRQSSGTTHAVYYHNTEDTPTHQALDPAKSADSIGDPFATYPNHLMLQLTSSISPSPAALQPIPLPDEDEFTNRVLRLFDATETVDGHKAAVLFVGPGQPIERDILGNDTGNEAFDAFVDQLGFRVELKNAKFNTQGLDRGEEEADGSHTYAWRDRVTEIVYHLPTMMPNYSSGGSYERKKAHIGNDHVKIIFNCSGAPFDTSIFASEFNSVNIIITPEAAPRVGRSQTMLERPMSGREAYAKIEPSATDMYGYYLVQTISSEPLPGITAAATPQVISASGLPSFVRQIALTASVFCQIWTSGDSGYTSSWLFRLQQILKLRERHAAANASSNVGYPQAADAGPSPYTEGETWTGTVAYGGMAEQSRLTSSLDFTRWTK